MSHANVTITEHGVIQRPVSANVNTSQPDVTVNSAKKDITETRRVDYPMIANHVRVSLPTSVFLSDRALNVQTVRRVILETIARNALTDISVIQKEYLDNLQGMVTVLIIDLV